MWYKNEFKISPLNRGRIKNSAQRGTAERRGHAYKA